VLPSGAIVSATAFGAVAARRFLVPLATRSWTPVLAWGDWVGPAAVATGILLALFFCAAAVARTASRKPAHSPR
jgi:hypothetical protein